MISVLEHRGAKILNLKKLNEKLDILDGVNALISL
jgi:hypothetical protein